MGIEYRNIIQALKKLNKVYSKLWDSLHGEGLMYWDEWTDICIREVKELGSYSPFSGREEINNIITAYNKYKTPVSFLKRHAISKEEFERIVCDNLNILLRDGRNYVEEQKEINLENKPRIVQTIKEYLRIKTRAEGLSYERRKAGLYKSITAGLKGILETTGEELPLLLLDPHFENTKGLLEKYENEYPEFYTENIFNNIFKAIGEFRPIIQVLIKNYQVGGEELKDFTNFELEEALKEGRERLESLKVELEKKEKESENLSSMIKKLESTLLEKDEEIEFWKSISGLSEKEIIEKTERRFGKKLEERDRKIVELTKTIENLSNENKELREYTLVKPIPRFEDCLTSLKDLYQKFSSQLGLERPAIDLKKTFDEVIANLRRIILFQYAKTGEEGPEDDWRFLTLTQKIQSDLDKISGTEKPTDVAKYLREYCLELDRFVGKKEKELLLEI
ncbi:MAG: hypothetical protein ACE5KE_02465 [Methanosarcinales archaeon]